METAILLPVYCLLSVAALYFAGIGLLQQELGLLSRYAAEDIGATMPVADPGVTIPITTGTALADGEFARWNGDPVSDVARESPLTASQAREELVKASFRATTRVQMDSDTGQTEQETETTTTREGGVLFGLGVLYYEGENIRLVVDDELAGEFSAWFERRGVSVSTSHDAPLYQGNWGPTPAWSLAGLPVPSLSTRVFGVTRSVGSDPGTTLTRSLPHAYAGDHPASYLFALYWGGPAPVSGYPDYGSSSGFWERN